MKINKLLIAMIILLVATNFVTISKLQTLENSVSNLNNSIFRLDRELDNINGNVSRTLNEFTAEHTWTRKTRAQAVGYNKEEMTAGVDIEVTFNELQNDENIYIFVQAIEGDFQDQIEVTKTISKNLILNYYLDLPIGRDYKLSVVGESTELKRSESLGDVRLSRMMDDVVYVEGFGWEVKVDESNKLESVGMDITIHSVFEKDPFISEYFRNKEIVNIRGEIYANDVLLDTIEFLEDENWGISGLDSLGNLIEEESGVLAFKLGSAGDHFIDIHGKYVFKKSIVETQKVDVYVILTDNQGEEHGYQLYHIFE
ncbi:hypothetical protein SANA_02000 [Gottschalkiaceae bacterium SANA]|nr:hypothetical protein SANA_02000 [Gottschalkiaceae bacterium SANA]